MTGQMTGQQELGNHRLHVGGLFKKFRTIPTDSVVLRLRTM